MSPDVRSPYAGAALLHFLAMGCVPGVEEVSDGVYRRTLALPHGAATVEVEAAPGDVTCRFDGDGRDEQAASTWLAALVDADHDAPAADAALAQDPLLRPLVAANPGLRVHRDTQVFEVLVRSVLGQQISVAGARTLTARMVAAVGERVADDGPLTHLFPTPAALAGLVAEDFAMPRARGRALVGLARSVEEGELDLDSPTLRADLLALRGIGPWTVDHLAMRSLGDDDVFLPTDIGVRRGAQRLGTDLAAVVAASSDWAPWRSYALAHLWLVATDGPGWT